MTVERLLSSRATAPIVFLALCLIPTVADPYIQYLINLVLAYIVISIGQMIVLGFAGQFAFANAAFMGIGAYTAALLTSRLGVSFWLALPAAGVLCAVLGAIVGLPALRVSRVYLSIVTLAFGEMVTWVFLYWTSVTRGTNGAKLTRPVTFGIDFRSDTTIFFVVLIVTALLTVVAKRLLESRYGRAFIAIRENELVARCNGINVPLYKTLAFTISAFYAGIGGALFAFALGFIVPYGFGMLQLVLHFAIVMVGGLGYLSGAIIGAILLTILPEVLRGVQGAQEITYGALLMLFIVFMPRGLAGLLIDRRVLPPEILVHGWRREIGRGGVMTEHEAKTRAVAANAEARAQ